MRILITNDDSISSSVLKPLAEWATKLGDVTVVVPKVEQSAMSHAIQLRHPIEIEKVDLCDGVLAYTVDSTPADCVRFAFLGLNQEFDLVISGINRGYNMGQDIIYSGTVSAVMESAYLGVKAVALSTDINTFDEAMSKLDNVLNFFKRHKLFDKHISYNVNIPPHADKILFTRQGGAFYTDRYELIGDNMYRPVGQCVYEKSDDFSVDTNVVMHGIISVTPLSLDRTEEKVYKELTSLI